MIKVNYEIFGGLKTKLNSSSGTLTIENNTTIEKFVTEILGIDKRYLKYLDITVNEERLPIDKKLKNNCLIRVLMPVGGG
jgi:sulfur carrier protein ThiS